ncbi:MAG: hypothetical protein KC729_01735 [Candidatus Eisenbacteria bacterium]|uniref:Lipoprotein n=1 Tax=Eiseniibacteriota bacterium TaxID=2212470 RepID=A0A956RNI1_UNCEI|nr:hypothetical protein [Candidatus Eisenbacteria bacterium]
MLTSIRFRSTILTSLFLVLLAGCGTDPTTTPDSRTPPVVPSGTTIHGDYTETFGSGGGTMGDSDAWFVVPANALSVSTELTMQVCPGSETLAIMGPNGQTFAVACTLSIAKPASYDPQDVYHICLYNESTETWDDLGGTDNGSYVSLAVTHFSDYKLKIYFNE